MVMWLTGILEKSQYPKVVKLFAIYYYLLLNYLLECYQLSLQKGVRQEQSEAESA